MHSLTQNSYCTTWTCDWYYTQFPPIQIALFSFTDTRYHNKYQTYTEEREREGNRGRDISNANTLSLCPLTSLVGRIVSIGESKSTIDWIMEWPSNAGGPMPNVNASYRLSLSSHKSWHELIGTQLAIRGLLTYVLSRPIYILSTID